MAVEGTYSYRLVLDVKQAVDAYTKARQAHLSTVSALGSGAGALTAVGTTLAAAGIGLAAGIGVAITKAAEFERKLDYFGAVADATVKEYDKIREKALQLGADTIYTSNEVADSFVELAKSGVRVEQLLDGIGEAVVALGAANDLPLETAAKSLTTILNTFNIAAEDSVRVVDQLSGAALASSIDVQDLILTMTYAGASAKTAGIAFEDINGAIALLGKSGIKGSKAGTGLRQVIDKLIAPTKSGSSALRELGIEAEDGSSQLKNLDGTLKPLPQLLDVLNGSLEGMNQDKKIDILGRIFPITSLPTVLSLINSGGDALRNMNEQLSATSAMDIADQRLDNLSGSVEKMTGEFDNLILKVGATQQSFAKGLVDAIESVVEWINKEMDPAVLGLITSLTMVAAGGLTLIGALGLLSGAMLNMIQLSYQLYPLLKILATQMGITATRAQILAFALRMMPFAGLALLIGLVAGALAFFFTQTEQGQAIMAQLVGIFQNFANNVLPKVLPFLEQLAATVGSALGSALNSILPLLLQLAGFLGGVITTALTYLTPLFEQLAGIFTGGLASGGSLIASVLSIIGNILSAVIAPLLPIINQLLEGTAAAFAGVGQNTSGIEGIGAIFGSVLAGLINMIPVILTAVIQLLTLIIQNMVAALPSMVAASLQMFTGIVTAIVAVLPVIIQAVIQLITMVLTALVTALPMITTAALQLFTGLVNAIVTILPIIISAVTDLIIQVVMALVSMLPALLEAAISLFTGLVDGLVEVLPIIIEALLTGLVGVIGALVSLIPQILAAAIELFMGIVNALPLIIPPLLEALMQLITILPATLISLLPVILEAAVQLFMGIIQGLSVALPMIIEGVIGILPSVIEALVSMIPALLEAAIMLFTALVEAIPTILEALIQAVVTLITTLVPTLIGLVPVLLGAAVQLFMALIMAIPQIIGALVGAVGGLIGPIVDSVIKMVPELINAAVKFFKSIGEAIPRVIPQIVSQLQSMGRDMINGLVNGVKNMANSVINVVKDVVGGAVNFAKGLLGIKSPSRVFRGIGVNTIQGMIIGMQNMAPALDRQMNMVADTIDSFYDQVYAAREMDVMLNLATQMSTQVYSNSLEAQLATLNEELAEIAAKDTIHIEKYETINPEPEPASDTLPNNIRKAAHILNG